VASLLAARPALAETPPPPGLPSGAILQAVLGLLLVLGLIAAIAFFIRRFPSNRPFAQAAMKVVGGIAVGPRERVVLLEVGDSWIVIGIAPGQMRTLHTLPKGDIGTVNDARQPPFAQWLSHFVEQRKKNDPA
jgi:flagellar protein FliO/FliZ